jgi:hypothetical protein
MASDPMELAYAVMDELGADVADIRVSGDQGGELHLPGVDLLMVASVAVASAFFKGVIGGVLEETGEQGKAVGKDLVRRFTRLVGRLTGSRGGAAPPPTPPADPPTPPAAAAPPGSPAADPLEEFRAAASDAREVLDRFGAAAADLERYAVQAQAEVAATLRDLGVRDSRVQRIAPATTARLLEEVERDRPGHSQRP